MTTELVRYDEMCRAIDAAYEVDEVKAIRDKAVALEHYFRLAKNPEPERRACEIRLRAERKAGELRRQEEKNKGHNRYSPPPQGGQATPTNAERREKLDITKKQDEQWQALAAVPDEQFEAALSGPTKPTTKGILAQTAPKPDPLYEQAMSLWGRLRDLEREGILDRDPNELMDLMTDGMRADVLRLIPIVIAYLERLQDERRRDQAA